MSGEEEDYYNIICIGGVSDSSGDEDSVKVARR